MGTTAGAFTPPPGYYVVIREICDRHDVLFIADEVITGFGRLGTWFGIERWGVVPDMIAFAKGVTSGYLPVGGVIVQDAIFRTLLDAGPEFVLHHGFTYSGHPAVCAAALANLDIIEGERLVARSRRLAPDFAKRFGSLATRARPPWEGRTMQITRFSPLWPVPDAQYPNRLGRLCDHMLEARFQRDEHRSLFGHGMPPVDVIEERDTIRLVAELPGVKPEDVRISLEGNVLTLQGEKKEEERQDDRLYRCERTYGLFERAFTLPATIDANTIVAKFESGLLTVLLPKVEAAKPRQITVAIE